VVDDGGVAAPPVVGACEVVAVPVVAVEVEVEDVSGAVMTDGVGRRFVVVVEDGAAVPKTLSSATLV
jgi:hypothetical protein